VLLKYPAVSEGYGDDHMNEHNKYHYKRERSMENMPVVQELARRAEECDSPVKLFPFLCERN
jgi:hypothetical protein